ncbi:MAG: SpoIIE family protein phosphatase [Candidatus Eremiobacteraeota bacterium]|nr:SpoIIE family protein phosphatase [Candidatus Eremiobacteraeota bacterium]
MLSSQDAPSPGLQAPQAIFELADRETIAHFQRMADALPVLIWMSGIDKLCTWFNRTWLEFVGRPMESELGNGWAENVFTEDFDRCLEIYTTSFDRRVPFRMEYRLRHHTGEYRWILDEGIPLYDESREFVGYIGCCLDITDQKRTEAELQTSLERERRLAQSLQRATLPSNLAPVEGAIVSVAYLTAAEEEKVGGDWYDAFALEDGRVLLTVGDVTGHGLHASIVMAKLRHALNVVAMYENDPARMLDVAERVVLQRYPNAIATAFVAVVDPKRKSISFANAGHPRPIVRVRDGSLRQLTAGGLPVGLRRMVANAASETADLRDVDLLVLYTDGLTEATRNPLDGERSLMSALSGEAILFVRDTADFVKSTCLQSALPDDVAVLALNFIDVDRWKFYSQEDREARQARRDMLEILRKKGAGADDCALAEFIFGDLVANVARHAPGLVDVALDTRAARPVLHVIDRGTGYRPAVRAPVDPLAESGRGLWLIEELGAELAVETIPGFGTHTRVVLPINRAAGRASSP